MGKTISVYYSDDDLAFLLDDYEEFKRLYWDCTLAQFIKMAVCQGAQDFNEPKPQPSEKRMQATIDIFGQ